MYCEPEVGFGRFGQHTAEQMAEEGPGQYTYVSPWASAVSGQPPPPPPLSSVIGQPVVQYAPAAPAPAPTPAPTPSGPTVLPPPVIDTLLPLPEALPVSPTGAVPPPPPSQSLVYMPPGGGGAAPVSVTLDPGGAVAPRGFGMTEAAIAAGLAALLAAVWRRR